MANVALGLKMGLLPIVLAAIAAPAHAQLNPCAVEATPSAGLKAIGQSIWDNFQPGSGATVINGSVVTYSAPSVSSMLEQDGGTARKPPALEMLTSGEQRQMLSGIDANAFMPAAVGKLTVPDAAPATASVSNSCLSSLTVRDVTLIHGPNVGTNLRMLLVFEDRSSSESGRAFRFGTYVETALPLTRSVLKQVHKGVGPSDSEDQAARAEIRAAFVANIANFALKQKAAREKSETAIQPGRTK